MKNSELLKTLGSMNENEFREFGKFIASPYFNNRSEIVRLYDALKKYHPTFSSNSFKEELIFSKVYPGKKFSGVMMRKVFSLTTNLAMSFFAFKSFEDDKLGYNVKLLDRLR